jgi:ABC-type branched-subunit amino acid transport system substrate-binding protein
MIENSSGPSSNKEPGRFLRGIRNVNSLSKAWLKKQRKWLGALAVGVAGSLIAYLIITSLPKKPAPSPPPKVIATVGPYTGSQQAIWEEIDKGMKDAQSRLPNEYRLDAIDDYGVPKISAERAATICKSDQYLMVLGFVESNVAKEALPNYEYCPSKVPVIIIAATSTELTAPNRQGKGYVVPVLRLPPSNYHQASMIVEALGDTFDMNECKLLLIKDQDNWHYAEDLKNVFLHVLQKARTRCHAEDQWFNNLDTGEVWTPGKWDAIILFGMKEKAKVLLESRPKLRPQDGKDPIVIVTDGATTEETLQSAATAHFRIWGVFPASQPPDDKALEARHYLKKPSFYPYGYDAVMVAAHAIKDVIAKGDTPSRQTLKDEFVRISGERGHFIDGLAGKYEFGSDGGLRFLLSDKTEWPDELLEPYHFWYTNLSGNPEWQHRGSRSSLRCFTPADCSPQQSRKKRLYNSSFVNRTTH